MRLRRENLHRGQARLLPDFRPGSRGLRRSRRSGLGPGIEGGHGAGGDGTAMSPPSAGRSRAGACRERAWPDGSGASGRKDSPYCHCGPGGDGCAEPGPPADLPRTAGKVKPAGGDGAPLLRRGDGRERMKGRRPRLGWHRPKERKRKPCLQGAALRHARRGPEATLA